MDYSSIVPNLKNRYFAHVTCTLSRLLMSIFVISGFMIAYTSYRSPAFEEVSVETHLRGALSRGTAGLKKVSAFLLKRFQRVMPLYWFYTIFALTIFIVTPNQVNKSGRHTVILESFYLSPTDGVYLVRNGWTLKYLNFVQEVVSRVALFGIPAGMITYSFLRSESGVRFLKCLLLLRDTS